MIAVSLAVHGAVGAGIAMVPVENVYLISAPEPEKEVAVEVEVVEVEPVEFQFVDIPETFTSRSTTTSTPTPTTTSTTTTTTTPTSTTGREGEIASTTAVAPVETGGVGRGALAMRTGSDADISIPGESKVIEEILNRPPAETVEESGELEKNRNGSYTKRDLTFTAQIDADGHVSKIEDKPNFNVKLHIPKPKKIAKAVGRHLSNWAEDPYGVSSGTGKDATQLKGEDKTDGRVYTIISGGYDVTDAVMRWAGQDPYEARKREFLDRTFEERVQIGTVHRAEEMEKADQTILGHLGKLWARADLSMEEKRELVFELWDECAETGGEKLVAGGTKARAALYRWVNVHLPKDGANAFTRDELARLNGKRRSKATFTPYE